MATTAAPAATRSADEAAPPSHLGWGDYVRALAADRVALVACCFVLLVVGSAIAAELVAPHDPYAQAIRLRNKPPLTPALEAGTLPQLLRTHPLGPDRLHRLDLRARHPPADGLRAVLISGTLGVLLGLL